MPIPVKVKKFFKKHGPSVSKISFLVQNCHHAFDEAIARGAHAVEELRIQKTPEGDYLSAAIQGVGDIVNEFVEKPAKAIRPDLRPLENTGSSPLAHKFTRIDHLTNNVPYGEMEKWASYYRDIFGFVETRYFDIKGVKTGLFSKVMQLDNGAVIIPVNEPDAPSGKSQIQEYLDEHRGAGVQHIALVTSNIVSTVSELKERNLKFLDIPDTYYEDIPARGLAISEDLGDLKQNQILVDGDADGYLLQIFTQTCIGPIFFEVIQRKNHWGFGEGNFKALFVAMERDQQNRGLL